MGNAASTMAILPHLREEEEEEKAAGRLGMTQASSSAPQATAPAAPCRILNAGLQVRRELSA